MSYCIIYMSSALMTDRELVTITNRSQINNRSLGITGILLYFNGSVIEVLEGEEARVKALYEIISKDRRHTQLIKLCDRPISQRSFSDWFTGYKTLSTTELDHLYELIPFIKDQSNQVPSEDSVLSLVQLFCRTNYRN